MRGQISLEYLFLSVVSLALLSVSLFSLMTIKDYAMGALDAMKFSSDVFMLDSTADNLCFMGSGNSNYATIGRDMSIESAEDPPFWIIRFSSGNLSAVRKSYCQIEGEIKEKVETKLKNENGIIKIG